MFNSTIMCPILKFYIVNTVEYCIILLTFLYKFVNRKLSMLISLMKIYI